MPFYLTHLVARGSVPESKHFQRRRGGGGGGGGGEMASICVPPGFLQLNQVVVRGGGRLGVHHQRRRLLPFPIDSSRSAASILNPTNSVAFPFTLPCACRCELTRRWQMRRRIFTAFASNSNPSGGDSMEDKSVRITKRDGEQGPPFLTILAGLLVFLLVCWVLGSIVMWLYGLIVNEPPLK